MANAKEETTCNNVMYVHICTLHSVTVVTKATTLERISRPKRLSEEQRRRAGELVLKIRFLYFEREEARIELMALQEENNE